MKQRLEEIKLLALCMATDNRDAFSRLVEIHQQGLRRFLLNLTDGNHYLAEDLAQETFLKAWLSIRSFRGLSGFRTWLYRIAINEFISYRRKKTLEITDTDLTDLSIVNPSDSHIATEAKIDVTTLLAQLNERERTIAILFYLENMSVKEICKVTAMPEGTIKSHLSRARNHLAKLIKE